MWDINVNWKCKYEALDKMSSAPALNVKKNEVMHIFLYFINADEIKII